MCQLKCSPQNNNYTSHVYKRKKKKKEQSYRSGTGKLQLVRQPPAFINKVSLECSQW